MKAGVHVFAAVHWAVAGDDDDRHIGPLSADLACQFQSVHAFHAKVSDQDVEVLLLELLQRVRSVVGGYGFIALHFQDFAAQACQYLVVINEQNGFHRVALRATAGGHTYSQRKRHLPLVSKFGRKDACNSGFRGYRSASCKPPEYSRTEDLPANPGSLRAGEGRGARRHYRW